MRPARKSRPKQADSETGPNPSPGSSLPCLNLREPQSAPCPVVGFALILGIDTFMSEARAIPNVIGNGVATIVVARSTRDLNRQVLELLRKEIPADAPAAEIRR
jgi:Na+/H+-dicarboxylate symporter